MEYQQIRAEFDTYCDVCDDFIPKGSVYYEDDLGERLCSTCREV